MCWKPKTITIPKLEHWTAFCNIWWNPNQFRMNHSNTMCVKKMFEIKDESVLVRKWLRIYAGAIKKFFFYLKLNWSRFQRKYVHIWIWTWILTNNQTKSDKYGSKCLFGKWANEYWKAFDDYNTKDLAGLSMVNGQ